MLRWNDAHALTSLECRNKLGEIVQFDVRVQVINESNERTGVDCVIRPTESADLGDHLYFASFTEVQDGLL